MVSLFLFYVYKCFVCFMYVCMCVPGTQGDRKRALDPLELESQTVVSCPVGTGG